MVHSEAIYSNSLRFFSIINPIQQFISNCVLKTCLISREEIAKACTKCALYYCLEKKIFVQYDAFQLNSNHLIDYGCEAAWAGFFRGIDTVPGALIKYACVDVCYRQICNLAYQTHLDYPQSLKRNGLIYAAIQTSMPLIGKHCIGRFIDYLMSSDHHEWQDADYHALCD